MRSRSLPTTFLLSALLFVVIPILIPAFASASEPTENVSYHKQIRPIFQARCQGCHQPAKPSGGFVMTVFDRLLQGGESGEVAIKPGDPGASHILAEITPVDGQAAMPKGGEKPLSAAEIELVRLWIAQGAENDSPATKAVTYDLEHPPRYAAPPVITALKYSPQGNYLVVSGNHEVLLVKADGSGLEGRLIGLSDRIESASISPDGKSLAVAGGSPGSFGEIQIWDLEKRSLKLGLTIGFDTCYGASWSPNGKMVAFGCSDNTIRAIDPDTGAPVLFNGAHNDWVLGTAFSKESDHVVSVSRDMSMKLIEVATQRFIDNLTSITPGALKGGLACVDRHPGRDEFLVGGSDGAPKLFRMIRTSVRVIGDNANLVREYPQMPGRVFAVSFNRNGDQLLAASSSDGAGELRVFDTENGAEISRTVIPDGAIFAADFRPDGEMIAAGGFDGYIRLIETKTGKVVKQFLPIDVDVKVAGN